MYLFASHAFPKIENLNTTTWLTQRKGPSNNSQMTHLRKEKNPEMDYSKIKEPREHQKLSTVCNHDEKKPHLFFFSLFAFIYITENQ